jgi:hypothetical protein
MRKPSDDENSRDEILARYERGIMTCSLSSPPPALPSSFGSAGYFYLGANNLVSPLAAQPLPQFGMVLLVGTLHPALG